MMLAIDNNNAKKLISRKLHERMTLASADDTVKLKGALRLPVARLFSREDTNSLVARACAYSANTHKHLRATGE